MSGESSVSGSGDNHNVVPYDCNDKKAFQSSMEILKSSLGGKPTSTVISWA